MQLWFIPMLYVSGAGRARGAANPADLLLELHLSSVVASALLSAAASGMMVLTGIVFAMAS